MALRTDVKFIIKNINNYNNNQNYLKKTNIYIISKQISFFKWSTNIISIILFDKIFYYK